MISNNKRHLHVASLGDMQPRIGRTRGRQKEWEGWRETERAASVL
jgi:hypothetical protein